MSDSSTAVEVSNAQRGERILAASREEGEHTDFGNDKWKGTGPLSDWFLESCAWVERLAILALLYKLCTCDDASGPAWLLLALSFSSPCDFCPHMSCVMYRRGAWVRVAKALCWGEHIYHLCYSVAAQLRHSFTVLPLSPQALAHFLWGDKENKPKIRGLSSPCFNNLE